MTPEETNLMLTLLANAIAQKLTDQQLAQAAALLTQLGTTLGFLASQRALESAGQGDGAPSGDGVTTAAVATAPPTAPFCLVPTKVAVLTAMTPGVHWAIA